MAIRELEGLGVRLDKVVYRPDLEAPMDRPYAFAYSITIRNDSPETVTIKGRKWVVTESGGSKVVVEGDGLVCHEGTVSCFTKPIPISVTEEVSSGK